MLDLSVIIVTWNNEADISACVNSVLENVNYLQELNTELIIIDNNSSDKTYEILEKLSYPKLQIHRNPTNTGFTRAVNQGIQLSSGKFIFLLNPDTILDKDCLGKLHSFLKSNEDYAAACPNLTNADGSLQFSIRNFPNYTSMFFEFYLLSYIFPRSKVFNKWRMEYFDFNKDSDVLQPMAAALLLKKNVFDKYGLMDEQFEMFFNDVDICLRINQNNLKIRYLKDAKAVHKKGASIYKNRTKMIRTWNKDCLKYFKKYHYNFALYNWLNINLFITGIFRIIYHKIVNGKI